MRLENRFLKTGHLTCAVLGLARLSVEIALLFALLFLLLHEMHLYSQLLVPIRDQRLEASDNNVVAESLIGLGAPKVKVEQLSEAVQNASRATTIPWQLLIALMYTESTFNENAVSNKRYRGLMQIPQEIPYPDANILVGARILEDKVRMANGDLHLALAMYKGGKDKPKARRYATYTMAVYKQLRERQGGGDGCE